MYLIEMQQGERRHTVGLFESMKDAIDWIESIPYIKKSVDSFGEIEFVTYTMAYDDLPLYQEIAWQTSLFPLTKYMFTPDDGEIELFIWDKLPIMNKTHGKVEGMTQVDAYLIPNDEVEGYIKDRESLRNAIISYYRNFGKSPESGGVGSEDGEYIIVEDGPLIHLDALNVKLWRDNPNIEQFIE